jgi:hypothetical protein
MNGMDAAVVSTGGEVGDVQEIEVLESLGETTRFRYRVPVRIADGDLPALSSAAADPGATTTVVASGDLLVRGPVTGQRVHLSGEGETSWLDVLGGDRTLEMAQEAKITSWSAMRASDAVTSIVAGYGLIPEVTSTGTVFSPTGHDLVQRGTDLTFVRRLARQHGYLFWLSLTPIGLETAHFGPPPVSGSGDVTLALHLDGAALDEVDLAWESDRPTSATASGLDTGTLETLDASVSASPLPAMAGTGLAAANGGGWSTLTAAPGDDAATLTGPGQETLTEADLFVRARATTAYPRVGAVLHAHSLVDLDGLGGRHSGTWLVASVRHLVDSVSHRMECTFVRNGWEG